MLVLLNQYQCDVRCSLHSLLEGKLTFPLSFRMNKKAPDSVVILRWRYFYWSPAMLPHITETARATMGLMRLSACRVFTEIKSDNLSSLPPSGRECRQSGSEVSEWVSEWGNRAMAARGLKPCRSDRVQGRSQSKAADKRDVHSTKAMIHAPK